MTQLLVRFYPTAVNEPCSLCGQAASIPPGTQLVAAQSLQPVCHSCGKRHSPPLAALLDLADEAERVGRIGRHLVVAPYAALLDLARAADNFAASVPSAREAG